MKKFKITAELFMSADRIEVIEVKANTKRKAEIFAKEKLVKKFKTDMIRIISITEII